MTETAAICGHCGRPANGDAIVQVGRQKIRVCALPEPPYTIPCGTLITEGKHALNCPCWKVLTILSAIPYHREWCVKNGSIEAARVMSLSLFKDRPWACADDCHQLRMSIAVAIMAHPQIMVTSPELATIAEKVRPVPKLRNARIRQARQPAVQGVKIDPALRVPDSPEDEASSEGTSAVPAAVGTA
jgi:hypothetical protein